MASNVDFLIEMIKFDLQQIQSYREVILRVAVMCIAASCSVSAFLWAQSIDAKKKLRIVIAANAALLVILFLVGNEYFAGLNITNSAPSISLR